MQFQRAAPRHRTANVSKGPYLYHPLGVPRFRNARVDRDLRVGYEAHSCALSSIIKLVKVALSPLLHHSYSPDT